MRLDKFPYLLPLFLLVLSGLVLGLNIPDQNPASEPITAALPSRSDSSESNSLEHYAWMQAQLKADVEAYFEKAIASGDIVGAGVSIVLGDSLVVAEGFGERNVETLEKVDGQTIFRLGSLSKGFAGILVAKIVGEGKLNWEDRVIDYIPGFRLGDPGNTEKITLKNLLSHSSGAPYHSYTNLVEAGLPLSQIADKFREIQPISPPGVTYSYQNALFALSGEIIKEVTGEGISEALKNRFFNPLEMCSTIMDYESLNAMNNVALPHVKRGKGWSWRKLNDHYYNAIAAGGINASAEDMGKWMTLLLGHHPEVIKKSELEEAFRPVVEIPGRFKYYQRWPGHISSHYGHGWRIHKFKEGTDDQVKTVLHHGGSVNNFRNEIALYPQEDLGICVLLNSNSRLARNVVPDLYKIIRDALERSPVEIASADFSE